MRAFRNLKCWKKLMLISVVPLVIISICIGSMSYRRARQSAVEACMSSMQDGINRIDITLSNRARQIDSMVMTIAELSADLDESVMQQMCRELMLTFREIRSINIVFGESMLFSTEEAAVEQEELLRKIEMISALQASGTVWSDEEPGLFDGSPVNTIHVSYAIRKNGIRRGMVLLEIDPMEFSSSILTKQKVISSQKSLLLDRSFRVVGSRAIDEELQEAACEEYKKGRRSFDLTCRGQKYYCLTQYNALTGWITLTMANQKDLFANGEDLREYIVTICVFMVLLAIIVVRFLSYKTTAPLSTLNETMKQVQMRNLHVQIPNDRHDEIGELTDSFNSMMERIRFLIEQITQERLAQQSAEIEALQAQINPHFLYNTLDSINWMLIDRDDMDISRIIVALGKLMRYSMNTEVSFVPLRDEYQNILDYLTIQKNRLEDQLEFELELDDELGDIEVPKLILQPLVENSIKHAMKRSSQVLTIKVNTHLVKHIAGYGGVACITVSNDGVGMDEQELENYRKILAEKDVDVHSIGVRNVVKRLQLLFNDNCRFEVESTPGTGTVTRLYLPIAGGNHEDRNH